MFDKLCCFTKKSPVVEKIEVALPQQNNNSNSNKDQPSQFAKYTINSTPAFSIDGKCCYARVIDIGDTVTVALPLLNKIYKFNVALPGIDCYELNGNATINREKAVRARNRILELLDIVRSSSNIAYTRKEIRKMLTDEIYTVWVKCFGFERFGRLHADIYINPGDKHSIFEILLLENLVSK
jgi:hypothetical protein